MNETIKENTIEITRAYYLYSESEKYCEYVVELANGELQSFPLPFSKELSYKVVFQHQWQEPHNTGEWKGPAELSFERSGDHLEITLSGVKDKIPTVTSGNYPNNWHEIDWGKMVWDPEKEDYTLQKGLPKTFYLLFEDYKKFEAEDGTIQFSFDFENHLVLKDKDPNKNHIWYQFDWEFTISNFLYDTLSPYIKPENDKEVVAIPGELGAGLEEIWGEEGYNVNWKYYHFAWPEQTKDKDKDFYWENKNRWVERFGLPQLVISYLPTYEENWKLENKYKLTGTRWFNKLWEVFIEAGVPVVLKCYPGFIHINLLKKFPERFKKIDNIAELPLQINGKFTGTGNQLIFFNCPWLKGQKLSFKTWFEKDWPQKLDTVLEDDGPWNRDYIKK